MTNEQNEPDVAVSAGVHRTSLRVVGAPLPSAARDRIARAGAGEVEPWRRLVGTVFRWTRVFGHRVPRGVLLTDLRVRAGGVGAIVHRTTVEEVIAARLHTDVNVHTSHSAPESYPCTHRDTLIQSRRTQTRTYAKATYGSIGASLFGAAINEIFPDRSLGTLLHTASVRGVGPTVLCVAKTRLRKIDCE